MGILKTPPSHRRVRRLGVVASATLIGAALTGPGVAVSAAAATGNVVTLEVTAYKIADRAVGAGSLIPKGTVLTPVVLRTSDPDSGPLATGAYVDPTRLDVGETVTVSVNGQTIATIFPGTRPVGLSTSSGNFSATVFSIGGNSYVVPRNGTVVSGPTTVTTQARANNSTGSLPAADFGLLPAGAQPVSGTVLAESLSASVVRTIGTRSAVLYDGDGQRGTNPGEEWPGTRSPFRSTDVLVTAQFRDKPIVTVRGLQQRTPGPYGEESRTYLLETSGLGGRSLSDITSVISTVPNEHGLNWSALGFGS